MTKKIISFAAAFLASSISFALEAHQVLSDVQFPKAIKVIWNSQEYVTSDKVEIERILRSDLVFNPDVVIQRGEVSSVNPTTISAGTGK